MRTEEIAEILGISPDGVRKLVQRGVIKAERYGPRRRIKYDPESILAEVHRRGIELEGQP